MSVSLSCYLFFLQIQMRYKYIDGIGILAIEVSQGKRLNPANDISLFLKSYQKSLAGSDNYKILIHEKLNQKRQSQMAGMAGKNH